MFRFIYLFIITLFFSGCSLKTPQRPLETVFALDLERYSGRWIEIARYENRFEQGCVSATADYALKGKNVSVINRCYDETGKMTDEAHGTAHAVDESNNSRLKVTFFWPFYGDYWVIMLADDYRYSVVGDPNRKYLWILGRNSALKAEDKKEILKKLPEFGYDPAKLYWTKEMK